MTQALSLSEGLVHSFEYDSILEYVKMVKNSEQHTVTPNQPPLGVYYLYQTIQEDKSSNECLPIQIQKTICDLLQKDTTQITSLTKYHSNTQNHKINRLILMKITRIQLISKRRK